MIGTLVHRITVRTLDAFVARGRRSARAPVRVAAGALDRVRAAVGLAHVATAVDLPAWSSEQPERPMWESDRKKLRKWQVEQGIVREDDGGAVAAKPAAPVLEIYYKRGCPYARAAIELLREREIAFVEHDVKGDTAKLEWLEIITGRRTTPQIFVAGEPIGGYDELRALDSSGELARRIAAAAPGAVTAPMAAARVDDDEIEVADLRARIGDGAQVLLLDVRSKAELDTTGVLPHAVHAPMDELDRALDELDRDGVWIVYCHSGMRSLRAVELLRERGFRSVASLRGGIVAWNAAGGEVVRAGANTPRTRAAARRAVKLPVVHPERSPFEAMLDEPGDAGGPPLEGDALVARVREVLDECRPMIQQDGGDIELLDIQGDVVHVQLTGNCIGCPSSQATLRQGIERRLRSRIPQLKGIASPQLV